MIKVVFPQNEYKPIKIVTEDSVRVSMTDDNTLEITKKLTSMESEALFKDLFGTTDVGILNCGEMSDEEFNRIIDKINSIPNW